MFVVRKLGRGRGAALGLAAALSAPSLARAQTPPAAMRLREPLRAPPRASHHEVDPVVRLSASLGIGAALLSAGIVTLALTPDAGAVQQSSETAYLRALEAAHWQHTAGGILTGLGCGGIAVGALGFGLAVLLGHTRGAMLSSLTWGVAPTRDGAVLSLAFRAPVARRAWRGWR
jgi:hypothetical protein